MEKETYWISKVAVFHISQQNKDHLYFDRSVEIEMTKDNARRLMHMLGEHTCNCDKSLAGE